MASRSGRWSGTTKNDQGMKANLGQVDFLSFTILDEPIHHKPECLCHEHTK